MPYNLADFVHGKPISKRFTAAQEPPNYSLESLDMLEWYQNQIDILTTPDGLSFRGQRITKFHYWFLNFTPFKVVQKDKNGNLTSEYSVSFPYWCSVDDYIFKCMEEAFEDNLGIFLMGGRALGKEQPHSEIIKTPTGETTMGNIKVGDTVIAADGSHTKVLQKYPQGEKDVYKLTLSDGRTVKCGLNHLWRLQTNKKKMKTLELKDFKDSYLDNRGNSKYFIRTNKCVKYEEANLNIPPYVLGVLIGDGSLTQRVVFSSVDEEIINRLRKLLPEYDINHIKNCDYSITYPEWHNNPLYSSLKKYNLNTKSHHKYIPGNYLRSSKEQRLELLRGLMDTDGTITSDGCREFSTVSEQLSTDVATLCRSLGMKVITSIKRGTYKDNQHISFRVRIYTTESCFHLTRKSIREKVSKGSVEFMEKSGIVKIELLKEKELSSCITIEHESSLYLTHDFIVTHNTYMMLSILAWYFTLEEKSHSVISATNDGHAGECFNKMRDMLDGINKAHPFISQNRYKDSASDMRGGDEVIDKRGGKTIEGINGWIEKIIYGSNEGVTKGRRLNAQLFEEAADFTTGKGNLKGCLGASRGTWWVQDGDKLCDTMLIGTGGTVRSGEAKDVFMNPAAYELYDASPPEEHSHGIFIPAFYKYGGHYEKTGYPNIETAKASLEKTRKLKEKVPSEYAKFTQEYPFNTKECFRQKGTNMFNQEKIAEMRAKMDFDKEIPKPDVGMLEWKRNKYNKITGVKFVKNPAGDIHIMEHPELTDKGEPYHGLYVAGVDGIDMGASDSAVGAAGSKLAMLVKKRRVADEYFSKTSDLYVCMYNKRSDDVRRDFENCAKIAVYYNSMVNVEYTRIGIVSYFREIKLFHMLMKRPSIALGDASGEKASNLVGTPASTHVINHQDELVKEYIDDFYYQIYFSEMLQEFQEYQREDRRRFDLVIAAGLCELADEDKTGVLAAPRPKPVTDQLKLWGHYIDDKGHKRFGILPKKKDNTDLPLKNNGREETIRWVDVDGTPHFDDSDPSKTIMY